MASLVLRHEAQPKKLSSAELKMIRVGSPDDVWSALSRTQPGMRPEGAAVMVWKSVTVLKPAIAAAAWQLASVVMRMRPASAHVLAVGCGVA